MRSLKIIDKDIDRCKSQIAAAYDNHSCFNTEDSAITKQGFSIQLKKLEDEREKAQDFRNIEVINPRIIMVDASNIEVYHDK